MIGDRFSKTPGSSERPSNTPALERRLSENAAITYTTLVSFLMDKPTMDEAKISVVILIELLREKMELRKDKGDEAGTQEDQEIITELEKIAATLHGDGPVKPDILNQINVLFLQEERDAAKKIGFIDFAIRLNLERRTEHFVYDMKQLLTIMIGFLRQKIDVYTQAGDLSKMEIEKNKIAELEKITEDLRHLDEGEPVEESVVERIKALLA
jgi:hypothetical protein